MVFIMEPQLKPSSENQAIARVHRMGQTRKVTVHRLLAKDTVDESILLILKRKAQIFADYAHPSAVKEERSMAVDSSTADIEAELERILRRS